MLARALTSALMGAAVGGGGVIVSGLMQVGRMPAKEHIGGAAAMMGTIFGAGSLVRR